MDKRLALVTGAAGGIGRAVAEAFARAGWAVAINGRDEARLAEAAEELGKQGAEVAALAGDVTSEEDVDRIASELEKRWGRLDALVNNVGNFVQRPALEHTPEQWRGVLDSNLTSVYLVCRAMLGLLRAGGAGRIINVGASYASSLTAQPLWGPFAAAKAGVISLTRTLAAELAADGITVNAVCPGLIDTGAYGLAARARYERVVPAGRFGEPEEVARAVLFLADRRSGYISGSEIAVGGGWAGRRPCD